MTIRDWKIWLFAGGLAALTGIAVIQNVGIDEPVDKLVLAGKTANPRVNLVDAEIAKAKVGDEIVSLRSANAKTFKGAGGQLMAQISVKPRHYLDAEDGVYKPIDLTVHDIADTAKKVKGRKFDKYIDAGNYKATWKLSRPQDYTFYGGEHSVTYTSLIDTADVPVVTEYTEEGVKQTYAIVDNLSPTRLMWTFETTANVELVNSAVVFSAGGQTLFTTTAPVAWDANMKPVPVAVSLNGNTLIYDIDCRGAAFPVFVDPSTMVFTATNATSDGIISSDPNYNTARAVTDGERVCTGSNVFGQNTGYVVYRLFLTFDTSGLPDDANISAAKVGMAISADASDVDFGSYIVEGSFTGTMDISWFNDFVTWAPGNNAYSLTTMSDDLVSTAGKAAGDSMNWTFNSNGRSHISVTGNSTFMIISNEDRLNSAPTNKEYVICTLAKMWVTYTIPVPAAPTNFTNTGATDTTLSYSWTDNSIEDGFKIKNAGGDTATVGSYAADATTGTVEGLGINTRHGLRVFAFNATGWSNPSDSVVTYTLANAAVNWDFTAASSSAITPGFGGNSNPATTTYAIRDSTRQVWIKADGTSNGQTKAWQTEAQWEAINITGLSAYTQYRFGVVAKNGDAVETTYLWGTVYTLVGPPTVTTSAATNIGVTTATGNGNITDTGGENCTKRGICWNTTGNPTAADTKVEETGSFGISTITESLIDLTPNTTIYTKAYAYNSTGYGYGAEEDFITLANPPTAWNFTSIGAAGTVDVGFGANSNPAGTNFAVRDSTAQQWVQTNGTLGATIAWATYATWDAVTITQPGTQGTRRYSVMAKNGDNVNTAEVTGTLYVYVWTPPSNFDMTALSSTSIQCNWTNNNANYDSLLIMNSPENTGVVYAASGTSTTVNSTGLTPNTLYTYFVRADSAAGTLNGDSNSDSLYTLANTPTTFAFAQSGLTEAVVTIAFAENSNPATTQYAIRDSTQAQWVQDNGTVGASPDWLTLTAWQAVQISDYTMGTNIYRIIARNGDSVVNTTALVGSLNVYTFKPYGFAMTALTADSMKVEWTNQSTNYDSLRIENNADSVLILKAHSGVTVADTVSGLIGSTSYTWYVEADSSGVKGASNTDTETTPVNPPDSLKTPRVWPDSVYFMFATNHNDPTAITYSVRITYPSGAYTYWSGTDTTGTETFKTHTAWTDTIRISQRLIANSNFYIASRAKGPSDYSTWVSVRVRTWNPEILHVINKWLYRPTITVGGAVYDSSRAETLADSIDGSINAIGQVKDGINFRNARSAIEFRLLSSYPAALRDTLYMVCVADSSVTNFNINLYEGTWHENNLDLPHYSFNGWQTGMTAYNGTILNNTFTTQAPPFVPNPMKIVFNAAGVALHNANRDAGDTLRIELVSAEDVAASQPTTSEYITVSTTISLHSAYDLTETVPVLSSLVGFAPDSLRITWTDLSGTNTGYRFVDATTGAIIAGTDTVTNNAVSDTLTGLSVNTRYDIKVEVVGGVLDGQYSNKDSTYTRANTPGKPDSLIAINDSLFKFIINVNGNPAYTRFAVLDSVTQKFVKRVTGAPDTLGTGEDWATFAQWGGALGDTLLTNESGGMTLGIQVKAKSGQ